ncbi:sulfite exporter TauE/SafE family protein [Kushneria aurantia]|uniref:Probable membrane transporter protein n=1 Tax=Kushneria aurantia TaxID=504092 RepID=A0ABV6G1J3_9GAMM|nr:sulfite exporter TauE/SafE family protein [Kushneria aurantia]
MIFLLYLLLGAVAGVLAGLFGVGGGLIMVPVLVHSFTLLNIDPAVVTQMAVGTSLATIIFTSLNSIYGHHKKGATRWPLVGWMSLGIVAGSALGALTATLIPGQQLQFLIGLFAIVMAIQIAFDLRPGGGDDTYRPPGRSWLIGGGSIIGWASSIFGIGGGSLTVPFLLWRNLPARAAVGTSAACGLPIAIAGALSFMWFGHDQSNLPAWSVGYVYLPAVLGIALTSMVSARLGVRLAHQLPQKLLKRLFALLLVAIGISFLI